MAKRQSRRSVSLSRPLYTAALQLAAARGLSLAHFVDEALRRAGVKAPKTHHMEIEDVQRATRGRRKVQIAAVKGMRADGPIRRALGDAVADWCGEP